MSMGEMGKELGVNTSAISKYEKGDSKPGMEFIVKLCSKFDISANWLLLNVFPIKLEESKGMAYTNDSTIVKIEADKEMKYKIEKAFSLLEEISGDYKKVKKPKKADGK